MQAITDRMLGDWRNAQANRRGAISAVLRLSDGAKINASTKAHNVAQRVMLEGRYASDTGELAAALNEVCRLPEETQCATVDSLESVASRYEWRDAQGTLKDATAASRRRGFGHGASFAGPARPFPTRVEYLAARDNAALIADWASASNHVAATRHDAMTLRDELINGAQCAKTDDVLRLAKWLTASRELLTRYGIWNDAERRVFQGCTATARPKLRAALNAL